MIAVNKADGENLPRAKLAASQYGAALHILSPRSPTWSPPIMTCSALTGEGIEALWEHILDHRQRITASGELAARRGEQQVKWMWTMLEERMFAPLRTDRALKAALPRIEADVAAGRVAPASRSSNRQPARRVTRCGWFSQGSAHSPERHLIQARFWSKHSRADDGRPWPASNSPRIFLPPPTKPSTAICRNCSRPSRHRADLRTRRTSQRALHRDPGPQCRIGPVSRRERVSAKIRTHRTNRAESRRGNAPFARLLGAEGQSAFQHGYRVTPAAISATTFIGARLKKRDTVGSSFSSSIFPR